MTRIGQNPPSLSGQKMKARKTTPTAPQSVHPTSPATAQPAEQPHESGGEARFESNFDAPVRRDASKAKNFVTPPPPGHASAQASAMGDDELRQAVDSANELIHGGKASGPKAEAMMVRARQLANEGNNFNDIKYTLHAELLSEKTGETYTHNKDSGANPHAQMALQSQILNSAMSPSAFSSGMSMGDPLTYAVSNHARQSMQNQLFGKLATVKSSGPPAPMSNANLRRAVNDAHQLVFGKDASGPRVDDWMPKAGELASQLHNNFNDVRLALHGLLRRDKQPPAPGDPSDTQLRQALDDTHQVVFKEAATGPHLNAWMSEARKLAGRHDNNLDTVKLFLHSQMLKVK